MKRLITVRHGQSEGNLNGINQAYDGTYNLTKAGELGIKEVAKQNKEQFAEASRILTSPYNRAVQTANIIASTVDKPVVLCNNIVEMNPGILGGKTHKENQETYPDYYKIWKSRGDLDGIPNAEKGEELQARAIAFLMRYYEKEDFNDIIVSHSGFLRCLINTAEGKSRTTPIDLPFGAVNIIDNPLKNIKIETKSRAMSSKVFIVETADGKYVVKLKNRPLQKVDQLEKEVLNLAKDKMGKVPSILYMEGATSVCIKVIKYLQGDICFGRLTQQQEQELINKVKMLDGLLHKIDIGENKGIDLIEMVRECEALAKHPYVKQFAQEILSDSINKEKLKASKHTLAHCDLNRDNILFEKRSDGSMNVNILDWESIEICPEQYQIASFLVCSFLLEGYSVEETMEMAKKMYNNKEFDESYILYLMKFRIFKGLNFFVENRNIFTKSNENVSKEILRKYLYATEAIRKYEKGECDIPVKGKTALINSDR